MRVDIHEAETSTPTRPLWVWRIFCNGRISQGFCASQKEAGKQAELEQNRLGLGRRPGHQDMSLPRVATRHVRG
jgi:hypothetical protein